MSCGGSRGQGRAGRGGAYLERSRGEKSADGSRRADRPVGGGVGVDGHRLGLNSHLHRARHWAARWSVLTFWTREDEGWWETAMVCMSCMHGCIQPSDNQRGTACACKDAGRSLCFLGSCRVSCGNLTSGTTAFAVLIGSAVLHRQDGQIFKGRSWPPLPPRSSKKSSG